MTEPSNILTKPSNQFGLRKDATDNITTRTTDDQNLWSNRSSDFLNSILEYAAQ